jgi:single-stranded-DNA-specific exonuclease
MSFSEAEFNQMSGRSGRNGDNAKIHILFGFADGILNQNILKNQAPDRETVACVYKALKILPEQIKNAVIADKVYDLSNRGVKINETGVSVALGVLEELELIIRDFDENGKRIILIKDKPLKTNIESSIRYQEGQEEFKAFQRFRSAILSKTKEDLLDLVRHPICPKHDIINESWQKELLKDLAWLE